jgi:YHS domain-containing protein
MANSSHKSKNAGRNYYFKKVINKVGENGKMW